MSELNSQIEANSVDEEVIVDDCPREGLTKWQNLLVEAMDHLFIWWFSRRWKRVLEGAPALLIAGLMLVPVMLSASTNTQKIVDRYKAEVNSEIERNDTVSAELYLRKLHQYGNNEPVTRYALAVVAERKGEHQRAEAILKELVTTTGYPRAHLWAAKQLAAEKDNQTPSNRKELIHHLHAALLSDPPSVEATVMLGQIHVQDREYEKATKYFESVVMQRPELHLTLGQLYLRLNDHNRAKFELKQAAEYFQKSVTMAVNDVNRRVAWALACRLQGDYLKAKEILYEGLKIDSENSLLRDVLASFLIDEFDASTIGSVENQDIAIQLLEAALFYAPNNSAALNRLATICAADGDAGDRARTRLKDALATGKATATVHLILGIQAVQKGDTKKASLHFEQGSQLNPRFPELLNNFAWVLAYQENPQLERALVLVNRALEIEPKHPMIRETRGQINVKLARWREALTDLEFALPAMPKNRELHKSLARVYRELGDTEIAEKHEQIANRAN